MRNDWLYTPATLNRAASYTDAARTVLVIQRGPASWDAYHITTGSVVEGAFTDAKSALDWCKARVQ